MQLHEILSSDSLVIRKIFISVRKIYEEFKLTKKRRIFLDEIYYQFSCFHIDNSYIHKHCESRLRVFDIPSITLAAC